MVRIIMDTQDNSVEAHARNLVRESNPKVPRGVPVHTAQVPEICGDCGKTYWHRNDEYGWFPHIGCEGEKKGVGF